MEQAKVELIGLLSSTSALNVPLAQDRNAKLDVLLETVHSFSLSKVDGVDARARESERKRWRERERARESARDREIERDS